MEQLFADANPDDRLRMLENNAYNVEEDKVRRHFTPEELAEMRVDFTAESITLGDLKEEKSELVKELNAKIKEKEATVKPLLKKIRKGYSEQTETVFAFDDQENRVMNFYDGDGMFLHSRPLLPSERQTKIHSLNQKTA